MPGRRDPLRTVLSVLVYLFLYVAAIWLLGPLLGWAGGYLAGITATGLLGAGIANSLSMRIFEQMQLVDVGLLWNRDAVRNLQLGLLGGAGSAALVLGIPVLIGAAHFAPLPEGGANVGAFVFVSLMLLCGSAGEELLFRGYGFQVLLRSAGPWATILPVGVLFAALHAENPGASYLSVANTAGFGILFGYAFFRSRDLWLPIGLHFGWNFTLPLFGVNVSGLKIGTTGHVLEWTAGKIWSGGDYGPEASVLASAVLFILFVFLWKAPIRRQPSPLLDRREGDAACVPEQAP